MQGKETGGPVPHVNLHQTLPQLHLYPEASTLMRAQCGSSPVEATELAALVPHCETWQVAGRAVPSWRLMAARCLPENSSRHVTCDLSV